MEDFVALGAGGVEVAGFEGLAIALGAAFGMTDAVVNPPGAVVVPEVVSGFAADDTEGELADTGSGCLEGGHIFGDSGFRGASEAGDGDCDSVFIIRGGGADCGGVRLRIRRFHFCQDREIQSLDQIGCIASRRRRGCFHRDQSRRLLLACVDRCMHGQNVSRPQWSMMSIAGMMHFVV